MRQLCCRGILIALAIAMGGQALADQAFVNTIRDKIVERHWAPRDAAALAEAQELSFAMHDANGTLAIRLDSLGRYAGNSTLEELVARHPAWLDFFLSLKDPEAFAEAFDAFSDDQYRRDTLLEAILANPGPDGLQRFEYVVTVYGNVLGHLADVPEFGTLIDTLGWVGREGATPDFTRWLYDLLAKAKPDEVEALTVMLARHASPLRREIDIAARWEVLSDAITRNPDLRDLLLGHLDIWDHLDDTMLIDVVNVQLNRFDRNKAQLTLVFLLGYEGALDNFEAPEDWGKPLHEERAKWALDRLQEDPAAPVVELAFHFRPDDAFWVFVEQPGIEDFLPCMLEKANKNTDDLRKYFRLKVAQIRAGCVTVIPEALPGASLEKLTRKLWHGAPVETDEVGWAVLDVADAAFTAFTLGGGKLAIPVLKGGILAARALRGAEMAATLARGEKVAASSVKAGILEINAARRGVNALKPGLSRMLNTTPGKLVARAAEKADKLPAPMRRAVKEMADQAAGAGGSELIENALTTEFIRCAGIDSLSVDDPVCKALFLHDPATEGETAP